MLCMKEMPSSEFRKQYATLREPIAVTVNGHRIGAWIPGDTLDRFDADRDAARKQPEDRYQDESEFSYQRRLGRLAKAQAAPAFNSRGSRPVPKGK
jgi:hypothetical protein